MNYEIRFDGTTVKVQEYGNAWYFAFAGDYIAVVPDPGRPNSEHYLVSFSGRHFGNTPTTGIRVPSGTAAIQVLDLALECAKKYARNWMIDGYLRDLRDGIRKNRFEMTYGN